MVGGIWQMIKLGKGIELKKDNCVNSCVATVMVRADSYNQWCEL